MGAGALLRDRDVGQEQDRESWVDQMENEDEFATKEGTEDAEQEVLESKRKEEDEQELNRQIHIEKFKKTLLQRLHLSAPPIQSEQDGTSNRTEARRVLRSLPLALQGRLLNQMLAEDGAIEPPQDRTDEKETLILLKHCKYLFFLYLRFS